MKFLFQNGSIKRLLAWQLVWLLPLFFAVPLYAQWLNNAAERQALSPAGGPDPFFHYFGVVLLVMALGLFCCVALVAGWILIAYRKTRLAGVCAITCALAFFGGCNSGYFFLKNPRREAVMRLEERMTPLFNAIETYHRDEGRYPESLDVLVPKYLEKLPGTGMGKFTNCWYQVGSNARAGNPWDIVVPFGFGLGFYEFRYYPLQNYPSAYGYHPMGKWVFVGD